MLCGPPLWHVLHKFPMSLGNMIPPALPHVCSFPSATMSLPLSCVPTYPLCSLWPNGPQPNKHQSRGAPHSFAGADAGGLQYVTRNVVRCGALYEMESEWRYSKLSDVNHLSKIQIASRRWSHQTPAPHIYIYIYIYIYGSFRRGGGAIPSTSGVFNFFAVYLKMTAFLIWHVISFQKVHGKGFLKPFSVWSNSPICRNAGPYAKPF